MKSDADKWTWEQGKRGLNLSWDVLHHVKGEKNIFHLWGEEINMALSCYCDSVCVRSLLKSCQARDLVGIKMLYFVFLHKISVITALYLRQADPFVNLWNLQGGCEKTRDETQEFQFILIIFIVLILLNGKPIHVQELSHNAFHCS